MVARRLMRAMRSAKLRALAVARNVENVGMVIQESWSEYHLISKSDWAGMAV